MFVSVKLKFEKVKKKWLLPVEYPRVTEILRAFTNFHNVSASVLERAAARGSSVHAICAGIAKGSWVPDSMIPEDLLGYVNSFRQWMDKQVSKFVIVEKRYADDELQYTGQLDFVILGSDDKLYLVDIKTSAKPQKTYPVQMAAYKHLLERHSVTVAGVFLVYLDKDGEFPNIDFYDNLDEELQVFKAALICWAFFHKPKAKHE